MSLARSHSQWISMVAASIPTTAAAVLWATPILSDHSHWIAITATAISALFWSIAVHVLINEQCHRETRRFIAETINGLAECMVARVLDETYMEIVTKVLEHHATTEELTAARRNWRNLIGDNPVDLTQWRTERAADASAGS